MAFTVVPLRQVAMFVAKAGVTHLAVWVEYPAKQGTRTDLTISYYVPTLLPRGRVSMGILEQRHDMDLAVARHWLATHGYRILREMDDAPATC